MDSSDIQIIRRANKWEIIRTLIAVSRDFSHSSSSWKMFFFRVYILISDFSDITQYFIVLDLFDDPTVFKNIRKWNNIFFLLECAVWIVYYCKIFWKAD